jgi:hypothetical protein
MRGAVFFKPMPRFRISWPLAVVLIAGIIAILLYTVFTQIASWPSHLFDAVSHGSANQVENLRNVLADSFQLRPRISVKDRVVYQQSQNVLELTVLTKDTEITHETDQTWLGSTKHIRIRATFRLHAGFDLEKKCDVTVQDSTVVIRLPQAKILSNEVLDWNVEQLQDGLWNKIQPSDVQAELRALPQLALSKEPDLPVEAQQEFQKQLQERLAPLGYKVRIEFESNDVR